MKIIKIKYVDAVTINGQSSELAIPEFFEAVGFLVKETKDYIIIAREDIGNGDGEWRGQLGVPKSSILKLTKINGK